MFRVNGETERGCVEFYNEGGSAELFNWTLWDVFVDKKLRGKGYGKAILREVTVLADRKRQRVELVAMASRGGSMSTDQLVSFYRRFGFVVDKIYHNIVDNRLVTIRADMSREPKSKGEGV